ncbi:hypothetical protein O181_051511 [Austropuccinia psidii MF-1]|uniref:Uncharacterized protein n=1 Tax=Austropuccinia psidii MF-1 TaxID=1389203 RepID=A0A9Q3HNE5_9BASI|nr:hypothetical protein [Austropuccinia psidii MF-1]
MPSYILSYSILVKLCKNTESFHLVDGQALNDDAVANPDATLTCLQNYVHNLKSKKTQSSKRVAIPTLELTKSSKYYPFKLVYYCTNGKHNAKCTSHNASQCYAKYPELHPSKRESDNKRQKSETTATTHITAAQELLILQAVDKNKSDRLII